MRMNERVCLWTADERLLIFPFTALHHFHLFFTVVFFSSGEKLFLRSSSHIKFILVVMYRKIARAFMIKKTMKVVV